MLTAALLLVVLLQWLAMRRVRRGFRLRAQAVPGRRATPDEHLVGLVRDRHRLVRGLVDGDAAQAEKAQ